MDKLFAKQAMKQALHAANIFLFALIVFSIVFIHDGLRARGIDIVPFTMCLKVGSFILALCPNKRISLGLIALGFVLCYYNFTPPPRYMGAITLSVGALIFWGYIGDKKWLLFSIPLLIAITIAIVFVLFGLHRLLKTMLIYYGIIFFCVFCAYPARDEHWLSHCCAAIVVSWFISALWFISAVFFLKWSYLPYFG
ncbi:hypothetical protein [Helicobacter salomonis]|uniref:hypothetical protein n=1 Tax=Helicobacter salomonis TaxID=56878 RepID=UPI000CF13E1C|nr:hypothetical protein [Helicobacter salomonis]